MSLASRWRRVWGAESERDRVARGLADALQRTRDAPAAQRESWAKRAVELVEAKRRQAAATGAPDCCRACERKISGDAAAPFLGGVCCGGPTDDLFSGGELVLLSLAGRKLSRAPALTVQRGCAYRGVTGCVLTPEDRPVLCLEYMCSELRAELAGKGTLRRVLAGADALRARADALLGEIGLAAFPSERV